MVAGKTRGRRATSATTVIIRRATEKRWILPHSKAFLPKIAHVERPLLCPCFPDPFTPLNIRHGRT